MMNSCPACKKENPKIAIFCETCNYPFEGTEKEKAIHIGRFVTKKGVTVDSEIQINRSRSILFIIAIINGLAIAMGIVNSVDYSITDHVFNIIITSVFILCAITIKKNPFVKILIPLLLLSLCQPTQLYCRPEHTPARNCTQSNLHREFKL